LITASWDDVLRLVATIKLKESTASDIFRRLNSSALMAAVRGRQAPRYWPDRPTSTMIASSQPRFRTNMLKYRPKEA
jgi:hypothetical protein